MLCPAPAGVIFGQLNVHEFYPRWRRAQALLLPAALEAALRCAARLRLSQPSLEAGSMAVAHEAAGSCGDALLYLSSYAELHAQRASSAAGQACMAGGLEALPAEQLVCSLIALASTTLKVIATLRSGGHAAGPPLGLGSLEANLLGTFRGCSALLRGAMLVAPPVQAVSRVIR